MGSEIQLSIIEKVKKELEITDVNDPVLLYEKLYDHRNAFHPDVFPDDLKREAEEKFKHFGSLLTELKFFMDQERLNKKPNDLIPYQESYNIIQIKNHTKDIEDENLKLKKQIKLLEESIVGLNNLLDTNQKEELEKVEEELKAHYQPKKNNILVFGITVTITIILNIITNLTSIKEKIIPILPFDPSYLNYPLFCILIYTILRFLYQQKKYTLVKNLSHELVSPRRIKDFYSEFVKKDTERWYSSEYFCESDVSQFIETTFYSKKTHKLNMISWLLNVFIIKEAQSINYLKNIFIWNLLEKKLIKIGNPRRLERTFNINDK